MKKYLPVILVVVGVIVLIIAFVAVRGRNSSEEEVDEEVLIEVSLGERPIASLTPTKDGHWLKLIIEKLVLDAASLDYELLYKLPDGRTQGVPGTIKLTGQDSIERDLLLGSESSGKFRYDEGVEAGTLTLRFRNDKGQLIAKFVTDFSLQSDIAEVSTIDGSFAYTLDEESEEFFVAMETFGLPGTSPGNVVEGPIGVFSSSTSEVTGTLSANRPIYLWIGSEWQVLNNDSSPDIGIFVETAE